MGDSGAELRAHLENRTRGKGVKYPGGIKKAPGTELSTQPAAAPAPPKPAPAVALPSPKSAPAPAPPSPKSALASALPPAPAAQPPLAGSASPLDNLRSFLGASGPAPKPTGTSADLARFPPPPTGGSSAAASALSPWTDGLKPPSAVPTYSELQGTANQVRKDLAQAPGGFGRPPDPVMPTTAQMHAFGSGPAKTAAAPPADNNGAYQNIPMGSIMSTMKGYNTNTPHQEDLRTLPPARRAEKAMQYVKFWQREGKSGIRGVGALWNHVMATWRNNEIVVHPTYVALALILTMLLTWNLFSPTDMPWRPDGMFYAHNAAHDTCVSHYMMCAKGRYHPQVKPLRLEFGGIDKPGRGGPLNSCTKAVAMMLLSDNYLPGLLTALHMLRKFSRLASDYVVVVTPQVSDEVKQVLYQACVIVREAEPISDPYFRGVTDPMDAGRRELMTKLMVWALDEYTEVAYVDADAVILRPFDQVLRSQVNHGQIFAAAKSYSDPQHFGADMMLLHPAMDTLKNMKEKLEAKPNGIDPGPDYDKRRKVLFQDGHFLNTYFADSWLGNPDHRYPWGLIAHAADLAKSPKLVLEHVNRTSIAFKFEGAAATKPWLKGLVTYKNDLEMMYFQKLWWKQYYEMTDRSLPSSIDMYSLLELGEYDLYWKQMYMNPVISRKWLGRK